MTCPDSASGEHWWRLELVPTPFLMGATDDVPIEPLPSVQVCVRCGEVW